MKECSRCNKIKRRSEFYNDHRRTDGLQSHCKDCIRKARRCRTTLDRRDRESLETKTCSACNKTKPISGFYRDGGKNKGYRSQCKECIRFRVKNPLGIKVEPSRIRGLEEYRCSLCEEVKEETDFYFSEKDDRVSSACRSCSIDRVREKREEKLGRKIKPRKETYLDFKLANMPKQYPIWE